MPEHDFRSIIANRMKTYRKEEKMSLDAMARATGVSKAMLGQMERLESVPTIATLWKIASGLGLSFSSFFEEATQASPDNSLFPDDPNMRVTILFPFSPDTRIEVFGIKLSNCHHQKSDAHQAGIVEHVVVREVTMELFYENKEVKLSEGDCHRFHADVPHEYRAITESARFENIICYTL